MSYLTKEQYEYRAASAARRMVENRETCDTLTEDQHNALAALCSDRHHLHGHNMEKALYYSEFSEAQTWRDLLDNPFVGEPGRINANLEKAGLPTIDELELDEDLPDDQWSDCLTLDEAAEECGFEYEGEAEDHEDEISRAYADYGVELCGKFQEKINTIIEDYLRQIDQEHGTDYCPSGDLRVF